MISGINICLHPGDEPGNCLEALAQSHPTWAREIQALGQLEPLELVSGSGAHLQVLHADAHMDVLVVPECSTTMELAASLAQDSMLPPWGGVIAARQNEARGQMRRPWTSPAGNLHVSYLLPSIGDADPLWDRLMPLVLGWCLMNAFEELGAGLQLKWPNDLIQDQAGTLRKTCGVLIEDRGGQVIAGTGVNLIHAPLKSELRSRFVYPAGIIEFKETPAGPLALWTALVKRTKIEYETLLENSIPPEFIDQLSQRLLWLGDEVSLRNSKGIRRGRLLGLTRDGGLRISCDGVEETIYSGSISR